MDTIQKKPNFFIKSFSKKAWGEIDKTKLPKECFFIVEDPELKSSWKLPYREGAGEIDPETGMYSEVGEININGLRAVVAAIHGARSGNPMDISPEIREKIKGVLRKVFGGDDMLKSFSRERFDRIIKSLKEDIPEKITEKKLNKLKTDKFSSEREFLDWYNSLGGSGQFVFDCISGNEKTPDLGKKVCPDIYNEIVNFFKE